MFTVPCAEAVDEQPLRATRAVIPAAVMAVILANFRLCLMLWGTSLFGVRGQDRSRFRAGTDNLSDSLEKNFSKRLQKVFRRVSPHYAARRIGSGQRGVRVRAAVERIGRDSGESGVKSDRKS